jgi:citrate lyase beta subunit
VEFIDSDGNIMVPKAVRPIVDLEESVLGSKKAAKRQYRYGNLHIREYDTHYTVHVDRVNPLTNPLGHLLVDAPEYLAGAAAAVIVGRRVGTTVYHKRKKEGKTTKEAAIDAAVAGYLAGSSAGHLVFNAASSLKKRRE